MFRQPNQIKQRENNGAGKRPGVLSYSRTASLRPVKRRRNREKKVGNYRFAIQVAFALLCLWIGAEFFFFVSDLESGIISGISKRPPGVEGFLPISALMSLYYFFQTGIIHPAHPAGLFILVAIMSVSVLFGKSFCSWLCPVGFISELLADFGEKIMGRKLRIPLWLDYPLRSLKYFLLAFLVYAIALMSTSALATFLSSSYNIVADIKMYYFFADIGRFALIVIASLFVLSIVIRGFWCRYLCPYGSLLGILSLASPQKIRRDTVNCIDCGKCAAVCPSRIKVDKVSTVLSDECTSCMSCVDSCPVDNTLIMYSSVAGRKVPPRLIALLVAGLFMLVTGIAMLNGKWDNNLSEADYARHARALEMYGHPTSIGEIDELNKRTSENE